MDPSTKQLLTADGKETSNVLNVPPLDYSRGGVPDDITLQLRNVGSRVRRSVSQGYLTTPSSFTKAHSTNTIFRSERDTLRDIFAQKPSVPASTDPTPNKRDRFSAEESEEIDIDEAAMPNTHSSGFAMDLEGFKSRPIKPLRKNRKTVSDSVLTFGGHSVARPPPMPTADETEEEDWSSMMQTEAPPPTATPFQPLEL